MQPTLVDAVSTLFTIQRWNFLPRVDTWIEAENVAYSAHLGWALATEAEAIDDSVILHFLSRTLLKPLNKKFLSDVSYRTKTAYNDTLKEQKGNEPLKSWEDLLKETAEKDTILLFPREIHEKILPYLQGSCPEGTLDTQKQNQLECIVRYVQRVTALRECEINAVVYENYYHPYIKEITENVEKLKKGESGDIYTNLERVHKTLMRSPKGFNTTKHKMPSYLEMIWNLKYLRRWNLINRSVETTVLGHTYLVALLALFFARLHEKNIEADKFIPEAIARALFHDVPEALTGDIITPVKNTIKKRHGEESWETVEKKLAHIPVKGLLSEAPKISAAVFADDSDGLLSDISKKESWTVPSLIKDCDQLALVIECLIEKEAGSIEETMASTYMAYLEALQNSEWHHVREFCSRLAVRHTR